MKGLFSNLSKDIAYSKLRQIIRYTNSIKLFTTGDSNTHTDKDIDFWREYTKRKANQKALPPLESQEIRINKTIHSWKFSRHHSLINSEFYDAIIGLKSSEVNPFIILDVREESEHDVFTFPHKTKNGIELPVVIRSLKELNYGNYEDLSIHKYIVCVDSIGILGRRAANMLAKEGYLTLYVEGGLDMFIPLAEEKNLI